MDAVDGFAKSIWITSGLERSPGAPRLKIALSGTIPAKGLAWREEAIDSGGRTHGGTPYCSATAGSPKRVRRSMKLLLGAAPTADDGGLRIREEDVEDEEKDVDVVVVIVVVVFPAVLEDDVDDVVVVAPPCGGASAGPALISGIKNLRKLSMEPCLPPGRTVRTAKRTSSGVT